MRGRASWLGISPLPQTKGIYGSIRPAQGDVTAPTLVSAIVSDSNPNRIDLTWSEAMNSTISTSSAFAVSAGHTITAHTYVDATHTYLTVTEAFVNGEAARTLAYTQPGSNKMQDLAGNLLANFSGATITNNVLPVGAGSAPNPPFATANPTPGTGQFTPQFSDPLINADGSNVGTITSRKCYYSTTAGVAALMGGTSVSCTSGVPITGVSSGVKYVAYTVTTSSGESYTSNELSVTVS